MPFSVERVSLCRQVNCCQAAIECRHSPPYIPCWAILPVHPTHASTCIKGGAQLSLHRLQVTINVWHIEAQSIQVQASPGNNDTCRGAGGMRCMGRLSCWPACIKVAFPMQSV